MHRNIYIYIISTINLFDFTNKRLYEPITNPVVNIAMLKNPIKNLMTVNMVYEFENATKILHPVVQTRLRTNTGFLPNLK